MAVPASRSSPGTTAARPFSARGRSHRRGRRAHGRGSGDVDADHEGTRGLRQRVTRVREGQGGVTTLQRVEGEHVGVTGTGRAGGYEVNRGLVAVDVPLPVGVLEEVEAESG